MNTSHHNSTGTLHLKRSAEHFHSVVFRKALIASACRLYDAVMRAVEFNKIRWNSTENLRVLRWISAINDVVFECRTQNTEGERVSFSVAASITSISIKANRTHTNTPSSYQQFQNSIIHSVQAAPVIFPFPPPLILNPYRVSCIWPLMTSRISPNGTSPTDKTT